MTLTGYLGDQILVIESSIPLDLAGYYIESKSFRKTKKIKMPDMSLRREYVIRLPVR